MVLTLCMFLYSTYQPTNALNKIHYNTDHKIPFMTSMKCLHVSELECHPQGVYWNKGIQVQHAQLGTDHPHCYH